MEAMDIYIANVPFDDNNNSKIRPALVIHIGSKITVFKITSKYSEKSVQIRQFYYPIKLWQEAGLKVQSYVDTHRTYTLSRNKVFSQKPIGKLTDIDSVGLIEFIRNWRNL